MRLGEVLLSALDNPQAQWRESINGFPPSSRLLFLTMATCSLPIDLRDLQLAWSANGSAQDSMEAALRPLDDTFVRSNKWFLDLIRVDYVNPSVQDFAARYLDEHFDHIKMVLQPGASVERVRSVLSLAIGTRFAKTLEFTNIYNEVKANLDGFAAKLNSFVDTESQHTALLATCSLLGSSLFRANLLEQVSPGFVSLVQSRSFDSISWSWIRLLGDSVTRTGLIRLLGTEASAFEELLGHSATLPAEFELLVHLNNSIGGNGEPTWADRFREHAGDWPEADYDSRSQVQQALEDFIWVSEYLGQDPEKYVGDWESKLEEYFEYDSDEGHKDRSARPHITASSTVDDLFQDLVRHRSE